MAIKTRKTRLSLSLSTSKSLMRPPKVLMSDFAKSNGELSKPKEAQRSL